MQFFIGRELSLKLLELSLKAIVWVYKVSNLLNVVKSLSICHAELLHEVGDDDCGRTRHPGKTVDEDATPGLKSFLDVLDTWLKVLLEVGCRRIKNAYKLVGMR
jgi:hypothetical protein